jgi:hypothetical protein
MNILIVGNSQLACLKKAHDANNEILGKLGNIRFYVTPGGTGPYLIVKNDFLELTKGGVNPKFPPRAYPENTPHIPLSHYDLVIVSALGYIDGGFYYPSPATRQGLLFKFGPKTNDITKRLLSAPCYKSVIEGTLLNQPGFKFLAELRKSFPGRILVQPFPLPSTQIREHPDWPLNKMYENPMGAHKFFCDARDRFMKSYCDNFNAELLPYPYIVSIGDYFTPSEFITQSDGLHPYDRYGKLVIEQIVNVV